MPAFTAAAPGKIILFGEHAVVYGRPAIAIPVQAVQARAVVQADVNAPRGSVRLISPLIDLDSPADALPPQHPLRRAVELTAQAVGASRIPACRIRIQSSIPVAGGMGSGAAVSIALMRALSAYLGKPLIADQVSALAFEVEKIHHGSPSGIDNTVIAFETAVVYTRGAPIQPLPLRLPLHLLIADSGIPSPTAQTVGEVRAGWQEHPEPYERLFDAIAAIVHQAVQILQQPAEPATAAPEGLLPYHTLGDLMNQNHALLCELGVSSAELDALTDAARSAGAFGAKLSGGGRGGNVIALAEPSAVEAIGRALQNAGAKRVIYTPVG